MYNEAKVRSRLADLPPLLEPRVMSSWRDHPAQTWQLITSLASAKVAPGEVFEEWSRRLPIWLLESPWPVQLAAAEFAGSYGKPRLAADLYLSAAAHDAVGREFWVGRAIFIYDEQGDPQAARRAQSLLAPGRPLEPYTRAAVAYLEGDNSTARDELASWEPCPEDEVIKAGAQIRVALTENEPLTRQRLNAALRITAGVLAVRWSSTMAVVRAQLLTLQARRGESSGWDADLAEALRLLLKVRDERRSYRGDSAEAVALACHVALLMPDPAMAIKLGTCSPRGATAAEAADPVVCEYIAVAALQVHDMELAHESLKRVTEKGARIQLAPLFAQADGLDSRDMWCRAIEAAETDERLAQAMMGLAQAGCRDIPRLQEFASRHPEEVVDIQAVSELASGNPGPAIKMLRARRHTSITSASNLAWAYGAAGHIDDQVQTLNDAADQFGDASLSFSAVKVLVRAGRSEDAERSLSTLLAHASIEWAGRGQALRLAAQLAYENGRHDEACDRLRKALTLEPEDTSTRWNLVRILIGRGDLNSAWRELSQAPAPLEASSLADAQAWIQLHLRFAPPAQTVEGCLRLLRRFPDKEDFNSFVVTNLLLLSKLNEQIPSHALDDISAEMNRFFTRWPDNATRKIEMPDSLPDEQLLAKITELARSTTGRQERIQPLVHGLLMGRIPLSFLAAVSGKSYAETLVLRGSAVIPARSNDRDDLLACAATVRASADKDVILDSAAAAVLNLLPAELRSTAIGVFARVMTTDTIMLDTQAGYDSLALRSTGTIGYDEERDLPYFTEISQVEADRRADEAARLRDLIHQLTCRPQPALKTFDDHEVLPLSAWASAVDLAKHLQVALWSDDPVLRTVARQIGIGATSTPALLDYLLHRGEVTNADHEHALRTLIKAQVTDFPIREERLLQLAEDERWAPTSVAVALSRPAAWTDPLRAGKLFGQIVIQVAAHQPQGLIDWLCLATQGAAASAPTPSAASDLASRLLTIAIHLGKATSSDAAALTAAAREGLSRAADPAQPAYPDLLPTCAQLLRDRYTQDSNPGLATRIVINMFGAHSRSERTVVLQSLLSR
ncbi:PIN domain-containing protein [Actinomadura madurae]|uniref:PIN domain-containing protein n=1 Tax=Actinomadura madurae TaxID=1993 RepID=UPI0011BF8950|nr:tetratricopeptide repeat protein [Actinomadura madurae]